MVQTQGEKVLLKLDIKNAFNSIRRDTVLQAAQTHLPEIYPFIWDCYSSKTSLFHGEICLHSATGVQQKDSLGPALFALAIHRVTSKIKSDINVWYLDDGCISGDPQTVLSNAAIIRNGLSSVGLEINNSNCELLIVNNTTSQERSQTTKLFQDEFPSISIPAPNLWQLLGSPLHQDSTPLHLEAKTKMLDNIIENLELIKPHQAFFIMKNCFSIPKLIYLLRSALIFKCKEELEVFDTETNMEKKCNVSFGEEIWSQASLPIRHAGLGLCSVADLSLPCFLSSSHTCQPFTSLSQPGNPLWGWKRCNWRLVQTPWFITIRKGNTSSLGWPRLQGYTQFPAKHQ